MKGPQKMAELDIQEKTRRDDTFNDLLEIQAQISNLSVFPSLVWVWVFDVLYDIFKQHQKAEDYLDEVIAEGVSFRQIFDKFWDDAESLGIQIDLGSEIIDETIRDWMRDNDFLVALENDNWLDEENSDEESE